MRILFTHRFYWPDSPPYGVMLRGLAKYMSEQGNDVSVFTAMPSYRVASDNPQFEIDGDVTITRSKVFGTERSGTALRFLNAIIYCIGLFLHILRHRPNVVTAATFPPVIAALSAATASRLIGARFIYHMQDIHPEVSEISGGMLGKGLFKKFLILADNISLRYASAVVVLSSDMKKTIEQRGVEGIKIQVINNPPVDLNGDCENPPASYRKAANKIRLIFAGNLGRYQNLDVLAAGVEKYLATNEHAELVFLGDGAAENDLRKRWSSHAQIKFFPFLPFAQARVLLEESDVGLVSLQSGIYRVSFPSKVITYAGLGLPMLVLVDKDCELAQITENNALGVVPEELTTAEISLSVERLFGKITNGQLRTREWYEKSWSHSANHRLWSNLVANLYT